MTAKEQLVRLVRIQRVVDTVRQAESVLSEAPGKLEEIENRFRERNAEYVAIQDRFDELELDRKTRSGELTELEVGRVKYTDDLMQVKNQREYAAMLKEIDSVKSQISEHEEAILRDMEEIEKITEELTTHEAHIAEERETVLVESTKVENATSEAHETIERLVAERRELEDGLPGPMLASVLRLEHKRQGVFLSRVESGTCQACFVRVRPQVFQEIKASVAVHSCGNCRRYLYFEKTILPEIEPAAAPSNETDNPIEAVNGGAV